MKRNFLLVFAIVLIAASPALINGLTSLDWHVIGTGGGRLVLAPYTLDETLGQAVIGSVANGSYQLCAGFWCGSEVTYLPSQYIYLPVVLTNP